MARRLVPGIIGALVTLALLPSAASGAAKLVVEAATEPPDTQVKGGKWRATLTIANEGDRRAAAETVSFYLSRGRRFSQDDLERKLGGEVDVARLNARRQVTERVTLRIPQSIANGLYYLVSCLGEAEPGTDALNCRFSGQQMQIGGQFGAGSQSAPQAGPPGPPGPAGPAGGGDIRRIARQTLPIGRATVQGADPEPDFADDEKSNQRREILKVGPVSVVADCKRTTNGDGANMGPDVAPGNNAQFDENGDEAKILIYTDSGTVTFNSLGGSSRRNIPPGEQGATTALDDVDGDDGGEGKHMFLATARDPAMTDNNAGSIPEEDWETAFRYGGGVVAHSGGTEFFLNVYAGIGVLGAGNECSFGGSATVLG